MKQLGLGNRVLAGRRIDHHQGFMRCAGQFSGDNADDLFQFLHQVLFGVQPTRSIGNHYIYIAGFRRLYGIIHHRRRIGTGAGRLHPLAVARSVVIAKASAWMGSVVLGWWLAVVIYLLPRRAALRVAVEDTPGAIVAGLCALALVAAAMWLQHCCKSPEDQSDNADAAPG